MDISDMDHISENAQSVSSSPRENVGMVFSSTNDESETSNDAKTEVRSSENVNTENLEMNYEIVHTENKPEETKESLPNEEGGIEYCSTYDESQINIVSNAAVRSNKDVHTENFNIEFNIEKVLTESQPEASLEIEQECSENKFILSEPNFELLEETPSESPDLFYYSLPKPQKYNSFKQAVAKELKICEKSYTYEKRTPIITLQPKNEGENIIDLGIFDESIPAINPGSSRMKGPLSSAANSPACPSRSTRTSSSFMAHMPVSNPEEFPNRSQVHCKDSSVTETPGAKHRMLKEDLMEKMKRSKEQKFRRQKEIETMDNEEECELVSIEEADSSPDSDVENANSNCDPVEGAKHGTLKKDLMEKIKRSKEQKLPRQKHITVMDNGEEIELSSTEEADSSPDIDPVEGAKRRMWRKIYNEKVNIFRRRKFQRQKEIEAMANEKKCELPAMEEADSDIYVENANSDFDPVEDPIFSSFPSYQPGGGMKIGSANDKVYEGSCDSATSRTSFEEVKARKILPETMNVGTAEYNTIIANEELSRAECEDDKNNRFIAEANRFIAELNTIMANETSRAECEVDENLPWGNIFRTLHSYEDSVENICSGPFATPVEDPIESSASGLLFEKYPIDSLASRSPPYEDLEENLGSRACDEEVESYAKSLEDDSDENSERINSPSDDETAPGMKRKVLRKRKIHRVLSSSDESDDEMEIQYSLNDDSNEDLRSRKRCLSEDSNDENGHLVNCDDNNEAKRRKTHKITDFIENEAELSGEEASSDENESGEDEPLEAEPEPEVDVSQKKLMEMHMKHLKDDDDKLEKLIKNDFLDEGEFFNEDNERSRKFRWNAQDPVPEAQADLSQAQLSDSEEEAKVNIDPDKLKWQKETEVIKQGSAIEADENVLDEPTGGKKYQLKILTKSSISVNEFEAKTRRKVKRGSFMNKDSVKDVVNEETAKKIQCNDTNCDKGETPKYD